MGDIIPGSAEGVPAKRRFEAGTFDKAVFEKGSVRLRHLRNKCGRFGRAILERKRREI